MKLNNKKGISLIVLVITIVVMIVLAAAIILSLQSSGIIDRANEAKTKSDISNAKQVVAMANAEWLLDEAKIRTENDVTTFKEYANKKLTEAGYATSGNGGISLSDSGAVNTIYVDSKNKKAIIPEGFAVSTVNSEKTIENGLVIKDENGNEFVWVPVVVPTGKIFSEVFVRKDGYSEGLPQTYVSNESATEPYSTDSYTEEVEEYNAMKASVEKNGGFYIARYEAGKEGTNVVSKKGATVWRTAWGTDMTKIGRGAVYRARGMYKGSNSVVSTLCYGVQWDAVMNFMSDVANIKDDNKDYIKDSVGMGYYAYDLEWNSIGEQKVQPTGYYAVKNIYDMAGNVYEWTMEAHSNNNRVFRGGFYGENGSYAPASFRERYLPGNSGDEYGFRPTLYIK